MNIAIRSLGALGIGLALAQPALAETAPAGAIPPEAAPSPQDPQHP